MQLRHEIGDLLFSTHPLHLTVLGVNLKRIGFDVAPGA